MTWRPQVFRLAAHEQRVDVGIISSALKIAEQVTSVNPDLPPLFSLRHLSHLTDLPYRYLRDLAWRNNEDAYRIFKIRKNGGGGEERYRMICVPEPLLMKVQRWILHRILDYGRPHSASVAYLKGCSIVSAAGRHCGARWLIKLDVVNFFESVNEIAVYRVFRNDFGYQPLVSFELSRICTRVGMKTKMRLTPRFVNRRHEEGMPYRFSRQGHLPQGAPTSPALANFAVRRLDEGIARIASDSGLTYTRYADDITLSTSDSSFGREVASRVIGDVYSVMSRFGFSPNLLKSQISPPGSRKVVLGLLVDGDIPRLTRSFRQGLRQHLYYLSKGVIEHARRRSFSSVIGMRNHIEGKIVFAESVDPYFGDICRCLMNSIDWPV